MSYDLYRYLRMRIGINKLFVAISAVALCVAGIAFFYRHISHVGHEVHTNLHALVPTDADVVVYAASEATFPQQLTEQMPALPADADSDVRLSYVVAQSLCRAGFPNTELLMYRQESGAQVVVCRLSAARSKELERHLQQSDTYCPASKTVTYRGCEFSVSPLVGGGFLASVQLSPCLWAASFRHKPLKQLLDLFTDGGQPASTHMPLTLAGRDKAVVCLRGHLLSSLYPTDESEDSFQQWHTYRLALSKGTIELKGYEERAEVRSGDAHDSPLPVSVLRLFPDSLLPNTTWSYRQFAHALPSDTVFHRSIDRTFANWLSSYTHPEFFECRFLPSDTLHQPVVWGIPLSDASQAEPEFRKWLRRNTGSGDAKAFCYQKHGIYPLYKLPMLESVPALLSYESDDSVWITYYESWLLLAPSRLHLVDFILNHRDEQPRRSFSMAPYRSLAVTSLAVSDSLDSESAVGVLSKLPIPFFYESASWPVSFEYVCELSDEDDTLCSRWKWRYAPAR